MSQKLVQIVQKLSPGGLEVLALRLATSLKGQHTLISLEGDTQTLMRAWPRISDPPFRLVALDKKPGFDSRTLWRLYRFLGNLRPDAVLTHHAGPLIYGGLAARAAGVRKHIHVEHDVWHLQSSRRRRTMGVMGSILKPTIIGVSERMRPVLTDSYRKCAIQIVPNGVSLPSFTPSKEQARASLGLPTTATIVGAAGRLEDVKGHDLLVAAMARLPDDVILVLAGDGSQRRRLEEKAAQLELGQRVIFLGHRDELEAIYPAFDVFCQPSRNEGLPLSILEAQACGVRVVASAVGDVPSGVCPQSGELVPAGDIEALSSAIMKALRKEAPSPRDFIAAHFDFRHTADGYARIIEAI